MKALILFLIWITVFSQQAMAFSSDDEQIDSVFRVLETGKLAEKTKVLERLQWSTLTDPRLFDRFEANILENYQNKSLETDKQTVLLYQIRALGYSGNSKYKETLEMLENYYERHKVREIARRALRDFPSFFQVQTQLAKVATPQIDGPSEEKNYIRLLKTTDNYARRLAARAIYHEKRSSPVLIQIVSENLKKGYLTEGLSSLAQDTLAWYCKVLKQVGGHDELLQTVKDNTPYKKIRKYAAR